jgi:hypothetical protein
MFDATAMTSGPHKVGARAQEIASLYGVLLPELGIALRGLFIIDPEGVLQHVTINSLPIGRNVDEAKRVLQAIQFVAEHGEVRKVMNDQLSVAFIGSGESRIYPDMSGESQMKLPSTAALLSHAGAMATYDPVSEDKGADIIRDECEKGCGRGSASKAFRVSARVQP